MNTLRTLTAALVTELAALPAAEAIAALNDIRIALHAVSPMREEPVDLTLWVPAEEVAINDYNPNVVAPPEMKLLRHSIEADGFTQPIVTWVSDDAGREVVDGFHRRRVATEDKVVRDRLSGYVPVTTLGASRSARTNRIAATVRHNRARGKHAVDGMKELVMELTRRNWTEKRIGKELGMDADEVLRLRQMTGLAEMFADREFSRAWVAG